MICTVSDLERGLQLYILCSRSQVNIKDKFSNWRKRVCVWQAINKEGFINEVVRSRTNVQKYQSFFQTRIAFLVVEARCVECETFPFKKNPKLFYSVWLSDKGIKNKTGLYLKTWNITLVAFVNEHLEQEFRNREILIVS